jgi:small subunit ribosomal protein S6
MRLYESVFIARQDIASAQVESMADEFTEIITSAGGSIKKREYWGLRSLAYRIKKKPERPLCHVQYGNWPRSTSRV